VRRLACLLVAVAATLAANVGAGAEAQTLDAWLHQQYLTGNWGGVRTDLQTEGITLRGGYVSEIAGNPLGGRRQGMQDAQQIAFGADLDLGRLINLQGGEAHVTFTSRAGQSLATTDIGNLISEQEIFGGGQNFRLAELSYFQSLFEDHLDTKFGWIHAADDFAHSPIYCYFQNNGFCGQPAGIPIDSGFTTFPVGSWGGFLNLSTQRRLYLEAGAYEVNPSLNNSGNGFKLGTSGATGVITPVEAGWQPVFGPDQLPGHYKAGAYYDNSAAPDLGAPLSGPPALISGRWGIYVLVDQLIFRNGPAPVAPVNPVGPPYRMERLEAAQPERGLTVFGLFVYAHPYTALLEFYWEAGLLYRGTFPGRDQDSIGLAVNQSRVSNALIAAQNMQNLIMPGSVSVQSAESDIELNYRAQLTPWFSLMPNIQYVVRPDAVTTIPNAFVLGLQALVTF
jgi:porin